jgi:hypothetical protein
MKKSELAAVAANGYWREPEARMVLAAAGERKNLERVRGRGRTERREADAVAATARRCVSTRTTALTWVAALVRELGRSA